MDSQNQVHPTPNATHDPFVVFTICANNFLASAKTLYHSLLSHHRDLQFHLILCDEPDPTLNDELPFDVTDLYQLGIPNLSSMIERYNITELNTALKPFAFLWLAMRYPNMMVYYFDPDILVMSPLEELINLTQDHNVNCVLTPHLLEPAEFAEIDDNRILAYGTFNLGFLGIRITHTTLRVLSWWSRRLEERCVIDTQRQLFVDQRWADLFPSFIEGTTVLRHPGYNVAYWNLAQRSLSLTRHTDGQLRWSVNGAPLRFFHFSGSVLRQPLMFSRHSTQFTLGQDDNLDRLYHYYVDLVNHNGLSRYQNIPYAFSWSGIAGLNEHTPSPT